MATKVFPGAARTGVVATEFDVVPTPNWPCPFTPQHHMAAAPSSPHACSWPSVSVVNTWPPAIASGPLPKLDPVDPFAPATPQQYAAPAKVRPHVAVIPLKIDLYVRPPLTGTGTGDEAVLLLPRRSLSCQPQHQAVSSNAIAQGVPPRFAICLNRTVVWTGC